MDTPQVIDSFQGEYRFLSNFELSPITVRVGGVDLQASSVEHAYQALKATNASDRIQILSARTPGGAKRLGKSVQYREDWEEVKVKFMRELVLAKFTQNPRLAEKLLSTGTAELVEGNWWGDRFWGVCRGSGQNQLGRILMWVRAELRRRRSGADQGTVVGAVADESEGEVEEVVGSFTSEVTTPLDETSASAPEFTGPFAKLDRWHEECVFYSFEWQMIKNQNFREVLHLPGVTDEVIRRLKLGDYWVGYFTLLRCLLNYDPTNPKREEGFIKGDVGQMAREWVEWYENRQDPSWWSEKESDQPSEQTSG